MQLIDSPKQLALAYLYRAKGVGSKQSNKAVGKPAETPWRHMQYQNGG